MYQKIPVLFVCLTFILAVRTADPLKCYMCTSLMNEGCDKDPKAHNLEPVECTLGHMDDWQRNVQQHNILQDISTIFEVDNLQHYQAAVPKDMACAKMVLKVGDRDVTVRSCQTAKTENIDPCKTIQDKVTTAVSKLEYCDLCMHDACNSSIAPTPTILVVLLSILGAMTLGVLYNGA